MQSASIRVLLVEDDPADVEFVRRKLSLASQSRFELCHAGRLSDAIERLSSDPLDVVLLDLGLSGCDELDAMTALRQVNHQIPIVILTGLSDERTSLEALNQGAQDYLVKGEFTADTLVRSIRYAIQRQQILAELARRDAQLRQSQKLEAVGALAGGIAHEFNNLLQAIHGYTMYALEGLPAGVRRRQDLEQVVKAADRAAMLTRQLLSFSRHQAIERVMVDPRRIASELLDLLRPLIGEHIDLQVCLAADVGSLRADPGLLQQMLLNLCINARDAMPDGGRLTLKMHPVGVAPRFCELHSLAKPGSYVAFSVADNGCGMSPELKERIFEPFFTTKEVGHGTGLGLAMVHGAVQQHEGAIEVESELGRGTTFTIYLPITAGAESLPAEPAVTPARGGQETILVAEDEPMVRDLAVRILTRAGYQLLLAADGVQAVELFQEHADTISLALLDAIMPKLTGREVYERIQLAKPDLPVVFCSGYNPETEQMRPLLAEGLRIVQKPFDSETLLRAVRAALDATPLPEALPCLA
ncbi:MAG TPA: response regulator [Pirellulales bacterium]|nr:response regulator [Pirellulales bacterium]